MDKISTFEYIIYKLIEWYKESYNISNDMEFNNSNDLSKLKILKLHFFLISINSKNNSLLNLFDNFYATPYGIQENDLYDKLNDLSRFIISERSIIIKDEYIDRLNSSFSDIINVCEINKAISILKIENIDMVKLSALDLVNINQLYFSWKYTFSEARNNNEYKRKVELSLIKNEIKYIK